MKRAENCVDCKITHIYFENDSLVFAFAKSKGHQAGEEHVGPWHIYANPFEPEICPVLALARYLLSFPDKLRSNTALFEGTAQYNRYARIFMATLKELEEELKMFGVNVGNLGTHSCRKGVASMVAAGCTVSPPIVSLCIRAGWVMGGVKDRYLKYESAGDQYVGRCASGLDQLSKNFAVSPPYFDFSSLEDELSVVQKKIEIAQWLKVRLTGEREGRVSPQTFNLLTCAFASLCFHYDFLDKSISQDNALRASPFFKDIPDSIQTLAKISFPWNKTVDTPKLTGVPPHVLLMAELETLQLKFDQMRTDIKNDMKAIMDERGVGNAVFHTSNILNAINESNSKVERLINSMAGGTGIGGALVAGMQSGGDEDDNEMMIYDEDDENVGIDEESESNAASMTAEVQRIREQAKIQRSRDVMKKRQLTMGYHSGRLQVLPVHWRFPKMTSKQLIENWFVGNKKDKIPPFALLNYQHVAHIATNKDKKAGKNQLRIMRSFMKVVQKYAKEEHCWSDKKTDWNIEYTTKMWNKIGQKHIISKFGGKRKGELSWKTTYNKMVKENAFVGDSNDMEMSGTTT